MRYIETYSKFNDYSTIKQLTTKFHNFLTIKCKQWMLNTFCIGINLQNAIETSWILSTMKHQADWIAEFKLVQQDSIDIIP